jgi:outer membrane beta-barrel protein
MTSTKILLLGLTLLLSCGRAFAEDIEVPEEELARESVLPVFDQNRSVLNRNVVTSGRLELGIGAGLEVNEPYYNDLMFTAEGTYYFNDVSALNVQGLFWNSGLSSYGDQLKSPPSDGTAPDPDYDSFDAEKAPHPEWGIFGNYQFTAYYGKISVTKKGVMNLSLFGIAGLGYINMGEVNSFGLNLGLGQNLFITKNLGLRFDLRWLIFQGPDATSQSLKPTDNPSAGSFSDRIYYNTQLGLGLIFVL